VIEKFNFYDIYGYFIPGLVLIGLVWLPFGLLLRMWPNQDISSAVLVILFAYILGHFIQSFAIKFMPSTIRDKEGNPRHPSELVVDQGDHTFTRATKKKLDELSQQYLRLKLDPDENLGSRLQKVASDQKELAGQEKSLSLQEAELRHKAILETEGQLFAIRDRRNDAFFLARSALLRDKKSSYWEQFEGLYALMRGSTAAFTAASCFFFGWGVALVPCDSLHKDQWKGWISALLVFFLLATLAYSIPRRNQGSDRKKEQTALQAFQMSFFFTIFFSGMLLALSASYPSANALPVKMNGALVMFLLGLTGTVVAVRCHGAYKAFAKEFAVAVWRDFTNLEAKWASPNPLTPGQPPIFD
jgi:hypothetical protein